MSGVVVPFRPRSEVPRRIPVVRTDAPELAVGCPVEATIEAGVNFRDLYDALAAGGFSLVFDQRRVAFHIRKARS